MVTIYGHPMSTCTRRLAVICKELGLEYKLIEVDLYRGAHKTKEFLKKQPFGQVPVMDDDGFQLYESRAIARYLAAKFGSPLLPTGLKENAKFEMAASIEFANFEPFAGGLSREKVWKPLQGIESDEALAEKLWESLQAKLAAYDVILGRQKYLAGEELTLADLFHLSYGHTIIQAGYKPFETPNLKRWWNDISSRPSWQAVKDGA